MRTQITKRQIEILQLMAEGYKEEDIADKLSISHITIRSHKNSLYKRLGVNNSVSAVITAIDLGLIKWELSTKYRIERLIEFKPEYLQSGITILNYFSTILRQKNPDLNSIVRIEQEGLNVRLLIIPEKGNEIEIIEKTLEQYGLVVSGKMRPSDFLNNEMHVLELENKLEISKLELRFAHNQLEYERKSNREKIENIENEVKWLRGQIGTTLSDMKQIAIGANIHLSETIKLHFPSNDQALLKSLDIIEKCIVRQEYERDKDEMIKALQHVKKRNPVVLKFIQDFAQKTITSASGKLLADLISSII